MRLVLGLLKSRLGERRKIIRSCWKIVLKEVWLWLTYAICDYGK